MLSSTCTVLYFFSWLCALFRLDWEIYYLLFVSNCIWLTLQALAAAARAAASGRRFAATAFFEGSVAGTFPLIADAYDTLKDVLVGALCIHSDSRVLKVLGIISWLYLAAIHVVFLGYLPLIRHWLGGKNYLSWRQWMEKTLGVDFLSQKMAAKLLSEMLGSYAAIMVFPAALKSVQVDQVEDEAGRCSLFWKMWSRFSNFLKGMGETLIALAYKQVTPVKRSLLAIENVFQGMVGVCALVASVTCRRLSISNSRFCSLYRSH